MNTSILHTKIFFATTAKLPCKKSSKGIYLRKNSPLSDKNSQKEGKICAIN